MDSSQASILNLELTSLNELNTTGSEQCPNASEIAMQSKTSLAPLRILMVIPGLPMGGAETFFVRLAKGLNRENQVSIYILSPWAADQHLMAELSGMHMTFAPFSRPAFCRYFYKLSQILNRILPKINLVDLVRTWSLRRLHRRYSFSVINPHLLAAERQVCLAFDKYPVPIVGSDHGDYRWVLGDQNFSHFMPVFHRSDALICPSESNLTISRKYLRPTEFNHHKIYYGYEFQDLPIERRGDNKPEFVFGMLSRGIPEKGWEEVLAAFIELHKQVTGPIRLVFVGEGEFLQSLQKNVPDDLKDQIEFAGYQSDPRAFISRFMVGLLPTYYKAESLPNVVIEYLAQGKPVIATDTGGIREMLEIGDQIAGIIVGKNSRGRADVAQLCAAMKRMINDAPFREKVTALALKARERFSMHNCLDSYCRTFRDQQSEKERNFNTNGQRVKGSKKKLKL
jgi:L-malate glycosyltransferase